MVFSYAHTPTRTTLVGLYLFDRWRCERKFLAGLRAVFVGPLVFGRFDGKAGQ